MKIENEIELTIKLARIGDFVSKVKAIKNENDSYIVEIPSSLFINTKYTTLDITGIVDRDIRMFQALNKTSDKKHQVYIDTLTICGLKISGNHIRIQYWFNQDGDENCHRLCAGTLTDIFNSIKNGDNFTMLSEVYSTDVCVYW